MSPLDIRPLGGADVAAAADVLGRAFADNPGFVAALAHLSPQARDVARRHVMEGFAKSAVRHQHAEAVRIEGTIAAVSLHASPGQYPVSWPAKVRQAVGCVRAGPRAVLNFLALDERLRRAHIREPHFYLFVLGVDPAQQGRGLGKALLRKLNARADAARLPSYLETDAERNVALYRSVGYEVLEDFVVEKVGAVRMWTMRRAPK